MLQRSKAVFKGNNDNIPYICDQFYTFILHDKSHTLSWHFTVFTKSFHLQLNLARWVSS